MSYELEYAKNLDLQDSLAHLREEFILPLDGIYLQGNSVGPPVRKAQKMIEEEIRRWGAAGMENLHQGEKPWINYIDNLDKSMAKLVGAHPSEVILMNGLSVNIHLLFLSFYHPTKDKHKILIEYPSFSSDVFALKSQIRLRGFSPEEALVEIHPQDGKWTLTQKQIEEVIDQQGDQIAVVFFSGVNFLTGQVFDIERISKKAKEKGIYVGFDLGHAVGNVPLQLHQWGVDFAVWCSYKYLSGGPGAIGGAYIHERHHDKKFPELQGWWGEQEKARFQFHLCPDFIPDTGSKMWQITNPPILGSIPLEACLEIYDRVGMVAFRNKSEKMSAYFCFLLSRFSSKTFEIITPAEPGFRGCQFSLLIYEDAKKHFEALSKKGVYAIFREPNILRIAFSPLYNTFEEVWQFCRLLMEELGEKVTVSTE